MSEERNQAERGEENSSNHRKNWADILTAGLTTATTVFGLFNKNPSPPDTPPDKQDDQKKTKNFIYIGIGIVMFIGILVFFKTKKNSV